MKHALVAILLACLPGVARAQTGDPYDRSWDVEYYRGAVAAPSQIIGKGGAVVGLAVGSAMIMDNPAAAGNRLDHRIDKHFQFDGTINWLNQNVGDIDNRGSNGMTSDRTGVLNLALLMNWGRSGIGITASGQNTVVCLGGDPDDCAPEDEMHLSALLGGLALGHVFLDDQLVVGTWFVTGTADIGTGDQPDVAKLTGVGLVFGTVWRPHGLPFRVGSTFRSPMTLTPNDDTVTQVNGLVLPGRIVTPWEWSVGIAYMWGPRVFNLRPTFGDPYRVDEAEARPPIARRYLLLTGDYVISGPSTQAVGISSWLDQTIQPVGQTFSTTLRLGLESEFWPNRMRGRVGTYYEPSRYEPFAGRFHGTAGLDARLFHLIWFDVRATAAIDVAPRYLKTGLSVGFWH